MSLYNMLFGMNPNTDMLLAIVGLKKVDVERFRDVSLNLNGEKPVVEIYTRTGGGNREDYPQDRMRHVPGWANSIDDDFDSTYCTDFLNTPAEFEQDIRNLPKVMETGIRGEFMQHLAKTLLREPTEDDKRAAEYEAEAVALERTAHNKMNGHTFVPYDDSAMKTALDLAEKNDGSLLSCWGIFPGKIRVRVNHQPYPNAKNPETAKTLDRVGIDTLWEVDEEYWRHCQARWSESHPKAMAGIADDVERYRKRKAG